MTSPQPWRPLLPRLQGLPLLPIGAGSDKKAPADPTTGELLKGWPSAAFTPERVAKACREVIAVGFRPGPDADGLIAFDIDGATAIERCRSHGCDPLTAPTWQVRRDTSADRLKVIWRVPAELRGALEHGFPKLTTKAPSTRGAGDGENVARYYGAGQVIVLGQHPTSGGNYFWPDGHGPAEVAEIPPDWWALADVIAKADPQQPKAARASSSTTSGRDWRRVNPCPICGRDGHLICSKHRDGRSVLCYHGSTFSPPELKPGEVITGSDGERWAFTGSRKHGEIGEFSHFKIHEPREARQPGGDGTEGFAVINDDDHQGHGDGPPKPKPDPEPLSYSKLIAATLAAVRANKPDDEMAARAEIMARFRRSDSQITKALIDTLTAEEGGAVNRATYGAVDLEHTAGMDWLIEGFIPERDQVLIYGEAGAGKTTAAVGMAFAVIDGTGFLDRASCAPRGSVLFIASDSGADPLKAILQSMGLMDHPAMTPDADHRFTVWAHDAGQGRLAWDASLRGCIALLDYIRKERPALVIIDSAKAVTSKADLNYCDNAPVTALLTFFKEVICQSCSVAWLHHDGTVKGSAAGAKAWREIPSAVHAIEHVEMGGNGEAGAGGGPRNQPWKCERMRWWKVKKCRMGTDREFQWELDEASGRPALIPGAAKTVVQDARAGIVDELWRVWQEGQRSLSRRELIDAMREQHGYSSKTTDNNLSRMVRAKHPEVCRLDVPRGHYKLAPRVVEMLTAAIPQPAPLITSLLHGKEQAKKPVTDSDLMTSREVPEGTRREQPAEPAPAAEFPRENLGKSSPASDRKGSGHVPSLGIVTPRARGAHQPPRGATALAIGARVAKWSQAERRHLPGWEVLAIDGDTVTITNGTGRLDVPIDRLKPDTDAPPEVAA